MSRRSLETSTPAKSRAVVFVVVGSKSFLLCHSRPVLADTGSPRLRTKGYRQLFGLSLLVLNGKGATTWRLLRGLDGPGPRSVCRAHPADFTSASKIQGSGWVPRPSIGLLTKRPGTWAAWGSSTGVARPGGLARPSAGPSPPDR